MPCARPNIATSNGDNSTPALGPVSRPARAGRDQLRGRARNAAEHRLQYSFHPMIPRFLTRALFCVALFGFGEGGQALAATADAKLNVVLILGDDLGWTDLGCFGSDLYRTPNIDRIAREGMKFTQAYSACTVCSPTRASLM